MTTSVQLLSAGIIDFDLHHGIHAKDWWWQTSKKVNKIEKNPTDAVSKLYQNINPNSTRRISGAEVLGFELDEVVQEPNDAWREVGILIKLEEASNGDCSAIFLVGGFSESLYLKKRIKEEFKKKQYVSIVSVPSEPACAIVRGAVEYGLNKDVIKNRVLKYNYGIVVKKPWTCEFPVARREECGNVRLMRWMATKGQQVKVGQKFSTYFRMSHEYQTHVIVDLYISDNITTYSDEPGVYKLGKFTVEVPDVHLGKNRRTEYELCFDQDEITATTKTHNGNSISRS
ncbi:21189_t:CDS:2 [Entrophospora sp. SA101]|nr:21189_t:CDS:2 [Entrophospora sp. SA101]